MPQITAPPPDSTSVYLYYDEHDVLIYVGITGRGIARNVEHNKSRPWWQYVARQEIEHFPGRALAHAREVALIEQHSPPFNVQHNREHQQMAQAYLEVRAAVDSNRDPVGLLRASGGQIPLALLDEDVRGNGRLVRFRTEARHAPIAGRLQHVAGAKLSYNGGLRAGHVTDVSMRGPFAVVAALVRKDIDVAMVTAQVKQLTVKGPPVFVLRRIKVAD